MSATIGADFPTVIRIDTSVRSAEAALEPVTLAPPLSVRDAHAGSVEAPPHGFKLKPVLENVNWKRVGSVAKGCAVFGALGVVPMAGIFVHMGLLRNVLEHPHIRWRDRFAVVGLSTVGIVANAAGYVGMSGKAGLLASLCCGHPYAALAAAGVAAVGVALIRYGRAH